MIWQAADELTKKGESFVCVTVTSARGSYPQEVGAKILVTKEGLASGTIGGGKVELAAIRRAQAILESGREQPPESVTWNLQKDIGMSCGGEANLLFEHFFQEAWPIVVFGAGHIAQALTRLLSTLNCQLTCVDSREEWLAKLEREKLRAIHHPEPKETVTRFSKQSFFLSMTMGHAFDLPILYEISRHAPDCPYVGVIGSEVKGIRIKRELKELGVPQEFLDKLRVPMGLPVGGNRPEEIAVSIAAELLQVRDRLKQNG